MVIYEIRDLINNKVLYFGRTKNFNSRKNSHITGLKCGSHPNKRLLEEVNKLGLDNISIAPIIKEAEDWQETILIDVLNNDICRISGSKERKNDLKKDLEEEKERREFEVMLYQLSFDEIIANKEYFDYARSHHSKKEKEYGFETIEELYNYRLTRAKERLEEINKRLYFYQEALDYVA